MKQKIVQIWSKIKNRWKSDTPRLAKCIRNLALTITIIIPSIAGISSISSEIITPDWFKSSSWYVEAIALIVTGSCQLQKKNESVEKHV